MSLLPLWEIYRLIDHDVEAVALLDNKRRRTVELFIEEFACH